MGYTGFTRILLAHNIRSLQNIGAFFRCADGSGFDLIVLSGFSGTPPRKEIHKTALGAEQVIAWEYWQDPHMFLDTIKDSHTCIALEYTDSSVDYRKLTRTDAPLCVIVGNEVSGVPEDLLDRAGTIMHLPMRGIKDSLNVSVAAGICMYHLTE